MFYPLDSVSSSRWVSLSSRLAPREDTSDLRGKEQRITYAIKTNLSREGNLCVQHVQRKAEWRLESTEHTPEDSGDTEKRSLSLP